MCGLVAMPERTTLPTAYPRFSWVVSSTQKNDLQTACQIRVAATVEALGKNSLWDTGRMTTDRSVAVRYAGKPLRAGQAYVWQVRTWNRQGKASAWSKPQQFRIGDLGKTGPGADRLTSARYPLAQTEVKPVEVAKFADGHYFLDFGRDAFGTLKLTVTATEAGKPLVIHLGEATEKEQRVHRKPGGSIRYERIEMSLQAGTHTYVVPLPERDRRRMPPEIGAVMPFRYAEVEGSPSEITAETARQVMVHNPFNDSAVSFSSSDPRLNAVWELCRYSMKATSFCGIYVDGDRERLPYEADAYINQLGHYSADREFTLARYSHEYLMQHPTWPTEWILHSVMMAWADYLYSGDPDSLEAFYQDLKAKALRSLAREDGLIVTAGRPTDPATLAAIRGKRLQDIVDWPPAERDGYQMRPVNTVVNAFHFHALVLMARIADALGKTDDAAMFRADAARVRRAFNDKLFNSSTGLYVDGEGSAHSSLHANMFALAFDLVPPERRGKVADFVASKGMACSVYGAQYLLEALYAAGKAKEARELITAPTDRSWAHMVYDVKTTITLEAWDNKYKTNQDWNHAWGAAPANILPRFLLGVEPTSPGFRTVRIRPQPGGLQRASLKLPTVRGTIETAFVASSEKFTLFVRLPANVTGQAYLPRLGRKDNRVTVDGVRRTGVVEGDFIVVAPLGSGAHTLVR